MTSEEMDAAFKALVERILRSSEDFAKKQPSKNPEMAVVDIGHVIGAIALEMILSHDALNEKIDSLAAQVLRAGGSDN